MIIPIRAVLSSSLGNKCSIAPAIYRLLLMWQADWQQAAIAVFCCFITFILFLIKGHCLKTLNSTQVGEVLADAAEKS